MRVVRFFMGHAYAVEQPGCGRLRAVWRATAGVTHLRGAQCGGQQQGRGLQGVRRRQCGQQRVEQAEQLRRSECGGLVAEARQQRLL